MAVDLGRWKPELHPRDKKGRFRDSWKISGAMAKFVDALLKRADPAEFKSDAHGAGYLAAVPRRKKRTEKQEESLQYFITEQGNQDVQTALRAGYDTKKPGGPSGVIKDMDDMMEELPYDMLLTRVTGPDAFGLPPERMDEVEEWTGKLVRDLGFAPTNITTPETVPSGPNHVTWSILAPKGTQAVVVGNGNRDVILAQQTQLQIIRVDDAPGGGKYVIAAVAPQRGVGVARGLGRELPESEKAPAIEATPEELARRGLDANGNPVEGPKTAPQPVPKGSVLPRGEAGIPGEKPVERGDLSQAQRQQLEDTGVADNPGDRSTAQRRVAEPAAPDAAQREAEKLRLERERVQLEREKRLDDLQARLDKQLREDNDNYREENDRLRMELDALRDQKRVDEAAQQQEQPAAPAKKAAPPAKTRQQIEAQAKRDQKRIEDRRIKTAGSEPTQEDRDDLIISEDYELSQEEGYPRNERERRIKEQARQIRKERAGTSTQTREQVEEQRQRNEARRQREAQPRITTVEAKRQEAERDAAVVRRDQQLQEQVGAAYPRNDDERRIHERANRVRAGIATPPPEREPEPQAEEGATSAKKAARAPRKAPATKAQKAAAAKAAAEPKPISDAEVDEYEARAQTYKARDVIRAAAYDLNDGALPDFVADSLARDAKELREGDLLDPTEDRLDSSVDVNDAGMRAVQNSDADLLDEMAVRVRAGAPEPRRRAATARKVAKKAPAKAMRTGPEAPPAPGDAEKPGIRRLAGTDAGALDSPRAREYQNRLDRGESRVKLGKEIEDYADSIDRVDQKGLAEKAAWKKVAEGLQETRAAKAAKARVAREAARAIAEPVEVPVAKKAAKAAKATPAKKVAPRKAVAEEAAPAPAKKTTPARAAKKAAPAAETSPAAQRALESEEQPVSAIDRKTLDQPTTNDIAVWTGPDGDVVRGRIRRDENGDVTIAWDNGNTQERVDITDPNLSFIHPSALGDRELPKQTEQLSRRNKRIKLNPANPTGAAPARKVAVKKAAPAKKAPAKKAAEPAVEAPTAAEVERQQWLDDEREYGPKYAQIARAMRAQRIDPAKIATGPEDIRPGMYFFGTSYGRPRFNKIVRAGSGGKSRGNRWHFEDGNPQYLGTAQESSIVSDIRDYNETMRQFEAKRAAKKAAPAAKVTPAKKVAVKKAAPAKKVAAPAAKAVPVKKAAPAKKVAAKAAASEEPRLTPQQRETLDLVTRISNESRRTEPEDSGGWVVERDIPRPATARTLVRRGLLEMEENPGARAGTVQRNYRPAGARQASWKFPREAPEAPPAKKAAVKKAAAPAKKAAPEVPAKKAAKRAAAPAPALPSAQELRVAAARDRLEMRATKKLTDGWLKSAQVKNSDLGDMDRIALTAVGDEVRREVITPDAAARRLRRIDEPTDSPMNRIAASLSAQSAPRRPVAGDTGAARREIDLGEPPAPRAGTPRWTLTPAQRRQVDTLTPRERAIYEDRRDRGLQHDEAFFLAKGNIGGRGAGDVTPEREPELPREIARPTDRRAYVRQRESMSRVDFDALPDDERTKVLANLRRIADSGDTQTFRDSMGSTVRGGTAPYVTSARTLVSRFTETPRPVRVPPTDDELGKALRDIDAANLGDIGLTLAVGRVLHGLPSARQREVAGKAGIPEAMGGHLTQTQIKDRIVKALRERGLPEGASEHWKKKYLLADRKGLTPAEAKDFADSNFTQVEAWRKAKAAAPAKAAPAKKAAPRKSTQERARDRFIDQLAYEHSTPVLGDVAVKHAIEQDRDPALLRERAARTEDDASRRTDPIVQARMRKSAASLRKAADQIEAFDQEAKSAPAKKARALTPAQRDARVARSVKSRTEQPEGYPKRQRTPGIKADWFTPFPGYNPPDYTAKTVLDNDRTKKKGGWADPPDVAAVDRPFTSLEGEVTLDAKGRPRNPYTRTGVQGRGLLGKWGANPAADNIVTRINPETGELEIATITRGELVDGKPQRALPGGMVDDGETVSRALGREFKEETGADLDMSRAREVYKGYVDDPRNTDNAWMETTASHRHLVGDEANVDFKGPEDGTEIREVGWTPLTRDLVDDLYASHPDFVRQAMKGLLRDDGDLTPAQRKQIRDAISTRPRKAAPAKMAAPEKAAPRTQAEVDRETKAAIRREIRGPGKTRAERDEERRAAGARQLEAMEADNRAELEPILQQAGTSWDELTPLQRAHVGVMKGSIEKKRISKTRARALLRGDGDDEKMNRIAEVLAPSARKTVPAKKAATPTKTVAAKKTTAAVATDKGRRILGPERATLAKDLVKRYVSGESIQELANSTGRSYAWVHRVLTESGVQLRPRGGRASAPTKKIAVKKAAPKAADHETQVADALRYRSDEAYLVRELDRQNLTSAELRKVAAELDVDVSDVPSNKNALIATIAKRHGAKGPRRGSSGPMPAPKRQGPEVRRARITEIADAASVADGRAAKAEVLKDLNEADLRAVARAAGIKLPVGLRGDRERTRDEIVHSLEIFGSGAPESKPVAKVTPRVAKAGVAKSNLETDQATAELAKAVPAAVKKPALRGPVNAVKVRQQLIEAKTPEERAAVLDDLGELNNNQWRTLARGLLGGHRLDRSSPEDVRTAILDDYNETADLRAQRLADTGLPTVPKKPPKAAPDTRTPEQIEADRKALDERIAARKAARKAEKEAELASRPIRQDGTPNPEGITRDLSQAPSPAARARMLEVYDAQMRRLTPYRGRERYGQPIPVATWRTLAKDLGVDGQSNAKTPDIKRAIVAHFEDIDVARRAELETRPTVARDLIAEPGVAARAIERAKASGAKPPRGWGSDSGELEGPLTGGDAIGEALAAEQGFDRPTTLVTPEEFTRMLRTKEVDFRLFRGAKGGEYGKPAAEVHEEFRDGPYRMGEGIFGNGTYMTRRFGHANGYADKTPGSLGRFGMRRDAKIIEWDDLVREHNRYLFSLEDDSPEKVAFADPGRYAMARGYDAIFVPQGTQGFGTDPVNGANEQYVILNRGAIVSEVPEGARTAPVPRPNPGASLREPPTVQATPSPTRVTKAAPARKIAPKKTAIPRPDRAGVERRNNYTEMLDRLEARDGKIQTVQGLGSSDEAMRRITNGEDPAVVARDLRSQADTLERRDVINRDVLDTHATTRGSMRQAMGRSDAKRLRDIADELNGSKKPTEEVTPEVVEAGVAKSNVENATATAELRKVTPAATSTGFVEGDDALAVPTVRTITRDKRGPTDSIWDMEMTTEFEAPPKGWSTEKLAKAEKALHGYNIEDGDTSPWKVREAGDTEATKLIDEVMDESPLPVSVRTWRGIARPHSIDQFKDLPEGEGSLVGRVFDDPGFMSTSVDRDISRTYADSGMDPKKPGIMLRLDVPKGIKAIRFGGYGEEDDQNKEILLERGLQMTVTRDRTVDGIRQLDVTVSKAPRKAAPTKAAPATSAIKEDVPLVTDPEGDNSLMHGDSRSMTLAQAYAAKGRNGTANEIMELRRSISTNRGDDANDFDGPQRMVEELKRLRSVETDPALQKKLDQAIRELDIPKGDLPDLPDGTPPALRALVENLHKIPVARAPRGHHLYGITTEEDSALDRVVRAIREIDEKKGEISLGNAEDSITKPLRTYHESVDGAYRMWGLADRVTTGGKHGDDVHLQMREWIKGLRAGNAPEAAPSVPSPAAAPSKPRITREGVPDTPDGMAERIRGFNSPDEAEAWMEDKNVGLDIMREVADSVGVDPIQPKPALRRALAEKLVGAPAAKKATLRTPSKKEGSATPADLQASVESGKPRVGRRLSDRSYSTVHRVTGADGRPMIRKKTGRDDGPGWDYSANDQALSEDLSSKYGRSMGADVPSTYRSSDDTVFMDLVPGQAGGSDQERLDKAVASDRGRRLHLLDLITGNVDRHDDNIIIDADGNAHGIDHAASFMGAPVSYRGEQMPQTPNSFDPFAQHYGTTVEAPNGTTRWADKMPFTREEVLDARTKLVEMKPEFVAAGHEDWYDAALGRADAILARTPGGSTMRPATGAVGQASVPRATPTARAQARSVPSRQGSPAPRRMSMGTKVQGKVVDGYTIENATNWKRDGVDYTVEHPDTPEGRASARLMRDRLIAYQDSLAPDARGYQKAYYAMVGANPNDAEMAEKYGLTDFWSAASAGDGEVAIWQTDRLLSADRDRLKRYLDHELGHNIEEGVPPRLRSTSPAWQQAARSDRPGAQLRRFVPNGEGPSADIRGTPDASRPVPRGVTNYGTSDIHEDFAEAISLYFTGQVGEGIFRDAEGEDAWVPIWFRDLFPERAAVLDQIFPQSAAAQLAEIARLRPTSRQGLTAAAARHLVPA